MRSLSLSLSMGSNHGDKQVIVITGCTTGGIGHALARAFAATATCTVAATSRSISSMPDLAGDTTGRYFLQELDVSSDDSVRRALLAVIEKFGRIDILVNNAGIHCVGPLAEVSIEEMQRAFNTNVLGAMRMIQAVVPHMVSRKKGKIVNVGSASVLVPGPWAGAYIASKAALHALTDSLRLELKPFGIDVITLVPGAIRTNLGTSGIANSSHLPEWKLYKKYDKSIRERANISSSLKATPPDEFAIKAVAVLLKVKSPAWFSYGQLSTITAIFYHFPRFVTDFIYTKIYLKC